MSTPVLRSAEDSNAEAKADALLNPRFYTTDYAALDRIDVQPLRAEWEALMAEYEGDNNHDHFQRDAAFAEEAVQQAPAWPPELRQEFLAFLVSSLTSEFSGCALYSEIARRASNPDVKRLMRYMARDESRHANFLNQSLKDFGLGVDLSALKREKATTFFKPKYIFYATYLSEKIGYARYITIFRQFERHPELRFHPIFRWFERWCNDEFRHGESFALILRAHPGLLRGGNRLWIRFFLLAVYATMYVRDHQRPALNNAIGLDATDYDYRVFRITNDISRQVFPLSLDIDHPAFRAGMDALVAAATRFEQGRERGGLRGRLQQAGAALRAGVTLLRLFTLPVQRHALPPAVRMAPAW